MGRQLFTHLIENANHIVISHVLFAKLDDDRGTGGGKASNGDGRTTWFGASTICVASCCRLFGLRGGEPLLASVGQETLLLVWCQARGRIKMTTSEYARRVITGQLLRVW